MTRETKIKITEEQGYSVKLDSPTVWIEFGDPWDAITVGETLMKVAWAVLERKIRDELGKSP